MFTINRTPISTLSSRVSLLLAGGFVVSSLAAIPAAAQLAPATPEEAKIGRPSPFVGTLDSTPPSADPRDFSGMWRNPPRKPPAAGSGGPPPPAPAPNNAAPKVSRYQASSRYCLPGTMLLTSPEGGTEILQRPDELRLVTEEQHNNRRIYINQKHADPLVRSVNGDSIAHWDGDSLVIETAGFLGFGVSPSLVRTEVLTKSADHASLTDDISYADASGKKTPPAQKLVLSWAPGTKVLEYICEDGGENYMTEDYK